MFKTLRTTTLIVSSAGKRVSEKSGMAALMIHPPGLGEPSAARTKCSSPADKVTASQEKEIPSGQSYSSYLWTYSP